MKCLLLALSGLFTTVDPTLGQSVYTPYAFITLAGNGLSGSADGAGSAAQFSIPIGVAVDSAGNIFVRDFGNNTIREVTSMGVVTTLSGGSYGTNDGTGSAAQFNGPASVAVDGAGNLYVSDEFNYTLRKVTPVGTNWVVTTLAGLAGSSGGANGTGSAARFGDPRGVALDSVGNVYVADYGNSNIRKVTPVGTNWVVTTLSVFVNGPRGLARDGAGNLYVAASGDNTIRKLTPVGVNWVVTTLAGLAGGSAGSADGTGSAARFNDPAGVAVDSLGNVYVGDGGNNTIRKVTPAGVVTTLAGVVGNSRFTDGLGSAAQFSAPRNVAVDSAGNVYVADGGNNSIRKGYPPFPAIFNSGPSFGFNGGQFAFELTGPPGQLAIVDASTDLSNWVSIWTNTFDTNALLFSDPQPGVSPHRFYRARTPAVQ